MTVVLCVNIFSAYINITTIPKDVIFFGNYYKIGCKDKVAKDTAVN